MLRFIIFLHARICFSQSRFSRSIHATNFLNFLSPEHCWSNRECSKPAKPAQGRVEDKQPTIKASCGEWNNLRCFFPNMRNGASIASCTSLKASPRRSFETYRWILWLGTRKTSHFRPFTFILIIVYGPFKRINTIIRSRILLRDRTLFLVV